MAARILNAARCTRRLSHLQVSFLAELPALKGLSSGYLRSLAHCFHQVQFEPREVLVRQGDVSDCLLVLKSGQVRV
jgi:CRP-like cAMP-binding protein